MDDVEHEGRGRLKVRRTGAEQHPMRLALALSLLVAVGASAAVAGSTAAAPQSGLRYEGKELSGEVRSGGTLTYAGDGAVKVKFFLDGAYFSTDTSSPFSVRLDTHRGKHRVQARVTNASGQVARVERTFTVTEAPGAVASPGATAAFPARPAPGTAAGPEVRVDTVEEVRAAVRGARPGDVIEVADGAYLFRPRLEVSADGTAAAPITLRGSRAAVFRSASSGGDYGMHVLGDHWRIEGITVAHATKGVVLDGSVGTVLRDLEVHDIGDEGVHFRACSSRSQLLDSYVHRTGLRNPSYGEGVYVGSANSNWSKHGCDAAGRDGTQDVIVQGNVFRDIAAEGADLKEGTTSGWLLGNVFDNTGYSGKNSADSAVDVKGNGWVVEGNTVRGARGAFEDAFQVHVVYDGFGVGNVFRRNVVEGPVRGWGFGLYPARGNTVECDNRAPGASRGLANVPCR